MIQVENERQIVLGVILGAQVFLFEWGIRARPRARIQNPANQIIVIVLLADSGKIGREISADHVRAFADRMAGFAAALFEQFFSVRGVSWGLLGKLRPGDRRLPDVGGDGLNFVILQAELRHFRRGTEIARVPDPVRNPFLVNLHPDFFQVRTDLLDFLQQVVRALVE